jgi:UDP-perosamine 4-acetyltransferase
MSFVAPARQRSDAAGTDRAEPYDRRVPRPRPEHPLPIVGLGAGTHAKSLLEAIRSAGEFEVVALVDDDPTRAGAEILGTTIAGPEGLAQARGQGVVQAFAGVGGVGSSAARKAVFARLLAEGFELPPIVHAAAIVSSSAEVGRGCQILAGAVVNADAELGENVIVNTGAIVEHDCRIGPHVHLGPGAIIAGLVSVDEDAQIGMGAVVIQAVRIGAGAMVAAGAVVVRDVAPGARVAGVPAREMSSG